MNSPDWKSRFLVSRDNAAQAGAAGWYGRGYLPHLDREYITQFITFRLADSLPAEVIKSWQSELKHLPDEEAMIERFRRVEHYLDSGCGACWLRDERIAGLVQDALLHFHEDRYLLRAWCVMPNHVHALVTPQTTWSLEKITHSWKSWTAHAASKILARQGDFWMRESFDRYIRDETHFHRVVHYIEHNPVKAGLCEKPADWKWSSARWRQQSQT
ncbi:MAG: transposase [Blastocatellia bacterium]